MRQLRADQMLTAFNQAVSNTPVSVKHVEHDYARDRGVLNMTVWVDTDELVSIDLKAPFEPNDLYLFLRTGLLLWTSKLT